jgi:uncharacterized protein
MSHQPSVVRTRLCLLMKNDVTGGTILYFGCMTDKIEKVREKAREYCFADDYDHHILQVVKYARILAGKTNADREVVELAALLHDIAVKDNDAVHETVGAETAEKILKDLDYSFEVIKRVKDCILTHRTKGEPKTKEAEIIRNADAMAHIDSLPFLVKVGLEREKSFDKAMLWVKKKIEKADKKLTMPEAREIIREKYRAVRILVDADDDRRKDQD